MRQSYSKIFKSLPVDIYIIDFIKNHITNVTFKTYNSVKSIDQSAPFFVLSALLDKISNQHYSQNIGTKNLYINTIIQFARNEIEEIILHSRQSSKMTLLLHFTIIALIK